MLFRATHRDYISKNLLSLETIRDIFAENKAPIRVLPNKQANKFIPRSLY